MSDLLRLGENSIQSLKVWAKKLTLNFEIKKSEFSMFLYEPLESSKYQPIMHRAEFILPVQ